VRGADPVEMEVTITHHGPVVAGEAASGMAVTISDPGLIEGAAEGAGLGIRFLKHLARTRLLLHLVDIAPLDETIDPVDEVRKIEDELTAFGAELLERERWLVLNKVDLVSEDEREARCRDIIERLKWRDPVFMVSAINKQGTQELVQKIMQYLEKSEAKLTEEG